MKNKILLLIAVATLGLTTATMAQVPSYVPTNGLAGFWPFNGNANDESGNGNNGTVNGATLTSDRNGNSNSAYSFNSIASNFIQCGNINIPQNDTMSISFWFNCNIDFGGNEVICLGSVSNTTWGSIIGNNYFTMNYGRGCSSTGSSTSSIPLTYNSWHHVVFISTGLNSNTSIYFDGIFISNTTNANSSGSCNAMNLYFGVDIFSGAEYYDGKLDDIAIYNRALTQQEITDLYNGCQLSVSNQPTNQTININNNAQFIVGSSDTNATYQWQTNLGVGFQNLNNAGQYSGTAKDTLLVSNVSMSNNNQQFRCIINNGSCTDTSNIAVLSVNNNVGIHDLAQKNLFSVFPNPAKNTMHVKADHKLIGSVFTIYDNIGKAVKSGKCCKYYDRLK